MEYFINVYGVRKVIGFLKKIKDINEKGAEVGTKAYDGIKHVTKKGHGKVKKTDSFFLRF